MNKDYFLYEKSFESDKLVVFFSAASAKSFTGYKIMQDCEVNKLFIRDPNRSWYHSKINGVSEDIDSLIMNVGHIVTQYNKENIYFIGGSMGGYAALLFGIKLGIKNILAFGPQMILNSNMPNMPKSSIDIKYRNLYDQLKDADLKETNIHIWFGAEDLVDVYQISPLIEYPDIHLIPIKFSPHNVMYHFHKFDYLQPLVLNFINDINYDFGYVEEKLFFDNNFVLTIQKAIEEYYKENFEVCINYLQKIVLSAKWSGVYHWLGLSYFKLNQFDLAKENFLIALRFFALSDEVCYQLGLLYMIQKKYTHAEEYFRLAMNYAPSITDTHLNKLGASVMLQDRLEEALKIQSEALEKSKNNSEVYYQLGLIYFKLGDFKKSLQNYQISYSLNPRKELTLKHIRTVKKYFLFDTLKSIKCSNAEETKKIIEEVLCEL